MEVSAAISAERNKRHPVIADLVGGVDLSAAGLRDNPAVEQLGALIELLGNAEYWLSFDLAQFESCLAHSPSPVRELGVGVVLRYGEALDGRLGDDDLSRFREAVVNELPDEVSDGVQSGLQTLARMIAARDSCERFITQGYEPFQPGAALSVHALRASGHSMITIDGNPGYRMRGPIPVEIGTPIKLQATDDMGRPIDAPSIESAGGAPVLARDEDEHTRVAIFCVPGWYRLRVPGRAEGEQKVLAR